MSIEKYKNEVDPNHKKLEMEYITLNHYRGKKKQSLMWEGGKIFWNNAY